MRVVLDTNVLINGFRDDYSAEARLLDAVCEGNLTALLTLPIEREYRKIFARLIDDMAYRDRVTSFLYEAETVKPRAVSVVIDDPQDQKFIDAAVGGAADLLVTSDRHLLDIGEVEGVRIVTPQEAWNVFKEKEGGHSEWEEFVRGMGLGKSQDG